MVASISHNGLIDSGFYSVFLKHKNTDKWYEVKDLDVKEVHPQKVALSESLFQIWELQSEN